MRPLLLTGFEPFLDVDVNPSGEVVRALDGCELRSDVRVVGAVLPVSFEDGPHAFHGALEAIPAEPLAVISLGVHRGPSFRLERRARAIFESAQPDNDGRLGQSVRLDGPEERTTSFDLDRCERLLLDAGASHTIQSDDAGGYLCERIYRAGLDASARIGIPALFLHVPPVAERSIGEQTLVVERFLEALTASLLDP